MITPDAFVDHACPTPKYDKAVAVEVVLGKDEDGVYLRCTGCDEVFRQ